MKRLVVILILLALAFMARAGLGLWTIRGGSAAAAAAAAVEDYTTDMAARWEFKYGDPLGDTLGNHDITSRAGDVYEASHAAWFDDATAFDYYSVTTNAAIRDAPTTYSFSVAFWFYSPNAPDNAECALAWSGVDDLIILPNDTAQGAGNGRVFWRDLGSNMIGVSGPDLQGDWHHLCFVSSATNNHQLFTDGQLSGSSANTGAAGPFTEFIIGTFSTQYYDGQLSDVRVYTNALSTQQVFDVYTVTQSNFPHNCVFFEDFDDTGHGDGYQWTWTETDPGGGMDGFNGEKYVTGTNSHKLGRVSNVTTYAMVDLGAAYGEHYGRLYFYFTGGDTFDGPFFIQGNNATGSVDTSYSFRIGTEDYIGDNRPMAQIYINNQQMPTDEVFNDMWNLFEWHHNTVTTNIEWKLNDVDQTTLTGTGASEDTRYLYIQSGTGVGWTNWVDSVAISTNGWIGPVSPDYASADYGCVGFWDMNQDGSTAEPDMFGTNTLDVSAADTIPSTNDVPAGYCGLSRDFEESEVDYLEEPVNTSTLFFGGANQTFTAAVWVKPEWFRAGNFMTPMGTYKHTDNYRSWRLVLMDTGDVGGAYFALETSSDGTAITYHKNDVQDILINVWTHLAATSDDTNVILYTNGEPFFTNAYVSGIWAATNGSFKVGADNNNKEFDGLIDEVYVSTNALTAADIKNIYNFGVRGNKGR